MSFLDPDSSSVSMYGNEDRDGDRDGDENLSDSGIRINCSCTAAYVNPQDCACCEACAYSTKYDDRKDGEDCEDCTDENKYIVPIMHLIANLQEENPSITPEQIHLLVASLLKQHNVDDLSFRLKVFLDGLFHSNTDNTDNTDNSYSLDIDSYGRHEIGSIINIDETNMRVLSVGIFTFEARDVNYLALRDFIIGKMNENPQTDQESMYTSVDTWLKENNVDSLSFSDKCSLDKKFYEKGGRYDLNRYGRPKEGDLINFHGYEMIVRNPGIFSFDIEKP